MDELSKISVIIPNYNSKNHLLKCLESCQKQTFQNFEVIIIDDYSSDSSIEIAEKLAYKDTRFIVKKNKTNLGAFFSRQLGVKTAKGQYVVFLDPDDTLHPDALKLIHDNKQYDLLIYDIQRSDNKRVKTLKINNSLKKKPIEDFILKARPGTLFGTPGKAYSKKLADKTYKKLNLKIRIDYSEDVLFFYFACILARNFNKLNHKLYQYEINQNSITNNNSVNSIEKKSQDILKTCSIIKNYSFKTNIEKKSSKKIINFLMADYYLILSFCIEKKTERVKFLIKSFICNKNIKTLARIFLT